MSVLLLTIAACALVGPARPGVAVTITPESAGRPIELRTDQALLVRLPSNLVTGYRWSLAAAPSDVLRLAGPPAFERDTTGAGGVGAPGTEVWRFTPAGKGERTLLFDYRLPWDVDAPPVRQLSFTVTVR
ncbi:MAG: protease inhibitor I42 family protein [Candidatus Rokuibacteriota bacterium]